MKRIITYPVTAEYDNMTVRAFLEIHGYSHTVLVLLKKTKESILVNGVWYYVNDRLHTGDSLQITIDEPFGSSQIEPVALPFEIVYEDEDILVVNKPAGMPVHPSIHNHDNTLANAVMYYFNKKGERCTFRCVNRLDKDTTGLTIIAKHPLSSAVLNRQMNKRTIKRTYLAIVDGITDESGTINAPIARETDSAITRCVDYKNGETAVTHYKRLAVSGNLSLIELHLDTGRTHQIRVHMKHIGHPLIGDFLYYPDFSKIKRQALHSCRLAFCHPVTGKTLIFHASLPEDMQCILDEP